MDDGQQVKKGGVTLCTDSYKSEEISILRKALSDNFNLITSIHNKKGRDDSVYERIYINKTSLEEVKPLLKEHLHSSMLYKINENIESSDVTDNSNTKTNNQLVQSDNLSDNDFSSDID